MVKNELKLLRHVASAAARSTLGNAEAKYELADALEALAHVACGPKCDHSRCGLLYQRASDVARAEAVLASGRLYGTKIGVHKLAEELKQHATTLRETSPKLYAPEIEKCKMLAMKLIGLFA